MTMVLCLTALLVRYRMGVVEADQPPTSRPVQRQRIVEAVWLLRLHWHLRHDKTDPVAALGINDEHLPVEFEQQIKGRVARLRHAKWLSD